MTTPVFVTVPLNLTPEMMRAVRDNPLTSVENMEEWHTRLGWLICAWEVLLSVPQTLPALTPKEAP